MTATTVTPASPVSARAGSADAASAGGASAGGGAASTLDHHGRRSQLARSIQDDPPVTAGALAKPRTGTADLRRRPVLDADARRGLTLIGVPLLYAVLMLALPLAAVIALSLFTQDYLTIDPTPTLANFEAAWSEPVYRTLMLRSLVISICVTLLTLVFAYPIAYFLSFHVVRNKALWLFLITIPFWTSYLVRIFLWSVILNFDGVVNQTLMWLGVISEPLKSLFYSPQAVVLVLAHSWAPFAILPIFVALEKVDRSLLEAAADLGDPPLLRFWRIILPLSLPGVLAAAIVVFIPTIGDYATPRLIGGPDGLMIANMIEVQFKRGNNAPLGSALALSAIAIVGAVALVLVGLYRRYTRNWAR